MIPLLEKILCAILSIATAVGNTFVAIINHAFSGLGLVVEWLASLLPTIPEAPEPPEEGVLAIVNWVVPLAAILAFAGIAVGVYLAYMAYMVALRWLKAL